MLIFHIKSMQEPRIRREQSSPDSRRVDSDSRRRSRHSRSRSRSPSRAHHRRSGSSHRAEAERRDSTNHDHVRTSKDRYTRLTDHENDKLDRLVAHQVQDLAQQQVSSYIESEEFKSMVEAFKRRERQRILAEIEQELAQEKAALLAEGRQKLAEEYFASIKQPEAILHTSLSADQLSNLTAAEQADAILLQNKIKMEEQQRRNYEAKQKEDAERLQHVLYRKQIEVLCEYTNAWATASHPSTLNFKILFELLCLHDIKMLCICAL